MMLNMKETFLSRTRHLGIAKDLHEIRVLLTLGPVVQRVVSLTSSLRVILLNVLVDSIHNILIFFAEKM